MIVRENLNIATSFQPIPPCNISDVPDPYNALASAYYLVDFDVN